MKFISLFISFIFLNSLFCQTFYLPKCSSKSDPNLKIINILQGDNSTVINFEYKKTSAPEIYIYVSLPSSPDAFYIIANGKSYKLISSNGIGNTDGVTLAKINTSVFFSVTFEAIPKFVKEFDLIEGKSGTWNFYGIQLIDEESSFEDCDAIIGTDTSNKPSFTDFLSGVQHAVIINTPKIQGHQPAFNALTDYLKAMGFKSVNYIKNDNQRISISEKTKIFLDFKYDLKYFSDIKLSFYSSTTGDSWVFNSSKLVRDDLNSKNTSSNFYSALLDSYGFKKPPFDRSKSMQILRFKTCWTEEKLKKEINRNGCDQLEGIYEVVSNNIKSPKYRLAVRKIDDSYFLIYLSGAYNDFDWEEGEIKAFLEETATPFLYKTTLIQEDKLFDNNYFIRFNQGYFDLFSFDNESNMFLKMFPYASNNHSKISKEPSSSGTGFAISSDGYIVTNNHVTKGAKFITVKGINGDFSKSFSAKVIVEDKNNDLSIIKIDSPNFTTLGVIPFVIANRTSDVGNSVYVLGYPLRASMGDEIKLTNGIISSKSGFQGDVTSYQISAPVQPGNSGGPLFSESGNLLGVINAKHGHAENASYAIKASYLLNLIDLLPSPPVLQKNNIVSGKSLSEQVKIMKKFVYIIEVVE